MNARYSARGQVLPKEAGAHRSSQGSALGAILSLAAVLCTGTSPALGADDKSFEIYGFAMLDVIGDSKRVDPAWMDAFRPSKIATPEGQFGTNGQSSISVKQSRFGVKGTLPTGDSTPPVNFKFEFDMFGTGIDAGQTTIRLRHFYGEWGQLLAGQTTSLFMDIDIFPNTIDYWGPNGMVFLRLPQVRWTAYRTANDSFAVAIERPGNDIDPGNIREIPEYEGAVVNGDEKWPDLTGQYRHDDVWGHFQVAGILRQLGYEYSLAGEPLQKSSQTGWGIDVTAGIKTVGKDQLLLGVVHGDGIASYMNDGGMDVAPKALPTVSLLAPQIAGEAVPLTGVTAYYDHYWSSMWSSSVGYSFVQVDNTNFQSAGAFHKAEYASGNLLYYPADKVMLGVELLWGKRHNNDGTTGDDLRVQFSAKYNFGTKL